jgi:sigma-B regulation protein RsbU (phosphoserine phosphatase)
MRNERSLKAPVHVPINAAAKHATAEGKKVLLLVDDTAANLRVATSLLEDSYEVRIATHGGMALELMKIHPTPDLILLDVMMPGMNGYEVCARLKADPQTRDTPVIFLTGQSDVTDEQRGFQVGAVDYIQKPFSEAIIKARIQTHLTLRAAREQLSRQLEILRDDLETARQVQLSILPHQMPKIAGLEIAARYVPLAALGGDFYDFIVVDEKRIGMLVADVSGHGTPASLIASMLKISLADQTAHAAAPARMLSRLNQTLFGKFRHHYVTAAYVYVDMEKKILRYAGAGHPPILVRDGLSGNVREVLENGLILSSFREAAYFQVELPLTPGDWVVLYTDGVSEAKNRAGHQFGLDRFTEFLKNQRATGADEFADQLLDELWHWIGRAGGDELEDDVTFLALHVDGPST